VTSWNFEVSKFEIWNFNLKLNTPHPSREQYPFGEKKDRKGSDLERF
jgi:hypothetical protein